ncbi:PEP-CTERM sorting domain-containing protein, partial [Crocosphaera watsonii]
NPSPSVPEPSSLTMLGVLTLFGGTKIAQKALAKSSG